MTAQSAQRGRMLAGMALILAAVLACLSANAASAAAAPRRHFIVLIRASQDMRGKLSARIPQLLAKGLYEPAYAGPFLFNPSRDAMSIAFYSLSDRAGGDAASCKNGTPGEHSDNVMSAAYLFHWDKVLWSPRATDFRNEIDQRVGDACTFVEKRAPSLITWELALPDINAKLAKEHAALFDEVIVVDVEIVAAFGDPTAELDQFRQRWQTRGTVSAARLANDVLSKFRLDDARLLVQANYGRNDDWPIFPPGERQDAYLAAVSNASSELAQYPISLRFRRVEPTSFPEILVDLPKAVRMAPEAISSSSLRVVGDPPGPRIVRQEAWPLLSVFWSSTAKGQSTLDGSDGPVTTDRDIDAVRCDGGPCRTTEDGWVFPLWQGMGLPSVVGTHSTALASGDVRFGATFRYETGGIYDHLIHHTRLSAIAVETIHYPVASSGIFGTSVVGPAALAGEWRLQDGALNLDKAVARIEGRRALWSWIDIGLISVVLTALLGFAWYCLPGRGFRPRFTWKSAADPLVVDFNATGEQVVLLGTLFLRNASQPDPISRFLRKTAQESRGMTLDIDPAAMAQSPFAIAQADGAPVLGFTTTEQREPDRARNHVLSSSWRGNGLDGAEFQIFLERARLQDFKGDPDQGAAALELPLVIYVSWQSRWPRTTTHFDSFEQMLSISAVPKQAVAPLVRYRPPSEPVYFGRGKSEVDVGAYVFTSAETLQFARTFKADYQLVAELERRPLSAKALSLKTSSVALRPGETAADPVLLHCDTGEVVNPEPPFDRLGYYCVGPAAPGSDVAPKIVDVRRDPTDADLDVAVNKSWASARDVYWNASDELQWRRRDGALVGERTVAVAPIQFEDMPVEFQRGSQTPRTIMTLELANAAVNGKGHVKVHVSATLMLVDAYRHVVLDIEGNPIDPSSLIAVKDRNARQPVEDAIVLREGDPPCTLDVHFLTSDVGNVVDAVIPPEAARLSVVIEAEVWTDKDVLAKRTTASKTRVCRLETPLAIELLPPDTWLSIDFGTSAITVARGDSTGHLVVADLQSIQQQGANGGPDTLRRVDMMNAEVDTPFLPSSVAFDADRRQDLHHSVGYPGFPLYAPASLVPGEASFVGLPATAATNPDRVVYSLKSWFAAGSEYIVLPEPIDVAVDGEQEIKQKRQIRTRDALASTFGALAEAYLNPDHIDAGHIVVSRPNTLTSIHVDRYLDVVRSAFGPRLNIPRADRFSTVSESDAVAFYYISRIRNSDPPPVDTLLVYDFGAGTLDLSIVRIGWEWSPLPRPKSWNTLARLGVPVAGNHIDKLIAQVLHEVLSDPAEVDHDYWQYQFPIVAPSLKKGVEEQHRAAMLTRLWPAIRAAKHGLPEELLPAGGDFTINLLSGRGQRLDQEFIRPAPKSENYSPDAEKRAVHFAGQGSDQTIQIVVPVARLIEDPSMREFMQFATHDVISEALALANVRREDITSVVISGRGALWPGLRNVIWNQFPNADKPDLVKGGKSDEMKYAVVQGAIEYRRISRRRSLEQDDSAARPRLVVVLRRNDKIVLLQEEEWDGKRIDISAYYSGEVYQASCAEPSAEDFGSYRKYFYTKVPLSDELFDEGFARDGNLTLRRIDGAHGSYIVEATNSNGITLQLDGKRDRMDTVASRPAWPVGAAIILPEELD